MVCKLSIFLEANVILSNEIALRILIYRTDKNEDTLVAIEAEGSVCMVPLSDGLSVLQNKV